MLAKKKIIALFTLTFFSLLFFALCLNFASAFISPSSIALAGEAASSFFIGLLAIIAVNLTLFFKKIRKKFLWIIIVLSAIALIIIFWLFFTRFDELKILNDYYDNVSLMPGEIDLNNITTQEFARYTVLTTTSYYFPAHELHEANRSIIVSSEELLEAHDNFSEFVKKYNISKSNNILAICHRGQTSSDTVSLFRENGFNASFARLSRTTNRELLYEYYNLSGIPSSNLIIVPYDSKKTLVLINFRVAQIDVNYSNVDGVALYENFKIEMLNGKDIACTSNLHCTFTKYFLDSLGIKNKLIYKIPTSDEDYIHLI